ncbi:MAG TPA: glycogen-binding domain-containing protein [Gemmatimonadales bacterium]|nr:glycogen-binding domain-containing protein [Gemmatimonadales bacterium]
MRRRHAALLALFCVAGTAPAHGQLSGTLDMGAGTYRPDRAIAGGIASIVPSFRYLSGPFEVNALGVYSDAPAGRWNFQGATEAIARKPAFGFMLLEASGKAEWTSHYRVQGTTTFSGGVRAYLATGSRARAWIGGTFGRATALGARRPLRRTEVGGSTALGRVHLAFTLANTTVDRSYMLGPVDPREPTLDTMAAYPEPSAQHRVDRLALTDAVLSGRWRLRSFDFDATLGRRFSRSTPETLIWGLSASRDLAPTLALVAAAGRAGSDPVTSVPGARYLAVGLRLKVGAPTAPPLPARPAVDASAPFRIGPALAAGREIVIQAPRAQSVELAGDFTDWKPVSLSRWGPDWWRTLLAIPPGLHRLAIRIDGGAWRAPPGTRPVESEFGGQIAEVIVQ